MDKFCQLTVEVKLLCKDGTLPSDLIAAIKSAANDNGSVAWISRTETETIPPENLALRLKRKGSDPTTLLGEECDPNGPHIIVEYDINYYGGDYSGTGEFSLVPTALIKKFDGDVPKTFEYWTGLSPQHIINIRPDELFNAAGDEWTED